MAYGPGAYRAQGLPSVPPPLREQGGIVDTPLSWGHYAGLDSTVEVEYQLSSELHKVYERQEQEGRDNNIFCDAQRWRFENTSKIPYLLFLVKIVSASFPFLIWTTIISMHLDTSMIVIFIGVALWFCTTILFGSNKQIYAYLLLGAGALATSLTIVWSQGAFWGYWSEQTGFWLGMFLFFMALIGADALLWLYSRFYEHDGSEFNRRDGMLRIARRLRKPFVAPFYEFDPVMQLQVTPHGGHDYVLWLHHRYSATKVCLANKVHSLGLDHANLLAFWDTLQRYMDVEQSLPDLPILEQSRHLDPLTAAHDAAHARPPRRWRDLNVNSWVTKDAKQLRAKLADYPWQKQPCILKAKIDPGLSIEAYYRSQEDKGIHVSL